MKFIKPDFARAAFLYIDFIENNDVEKLSLNEINRFNFLIQNFLCCINFKTGSVKLNNITKIIKIKLIGDKKNDIYIVTFDITSDYSLLSPLVLTNDQDKNNNDFLNIKNWLNKISLDITTDINGSIKFKLNYKK